MITSIAVRLWVENALAAEDILEISDRDTALIDALLAKYLALAGEQPHMVELEFLDECDPLQRYFRIGTDPQRVVRPQTIREMSDRTDVRR